MENSTEKSLPPATLHLTVKSSTLIKEEDSEPSKKKPKVTVSTTPTMIPFVFVNKENKDGKLSQLAPPALVDMFDAESIRGRFGWYTLEQNYVPYIMRNGEKYCSVRMIGKYLAILLSLVNPVIYCDCTNINSYYVTEAERALLAEINCFHCDYLFGRAIFTRHEQLIKLDDAIEFYKFLVVCKTKLYLKKTSNKCGFLRINQQSLVPYVTFNKCTYVPLFYFEGADTSKFNTAINLKGWNLSYLKFCFKVQRIRDEFIRRDECMVANFEELKLLFEPNTIIEDKWPDDINKDEEFTNKSDSNNKTIFIPWFKPPLQATIPQVPLKP